MNIICFTKYTKSGPSSRYRTYQYVTYWVEHGYNVKIKPLFGSSYISNFLNNRKINYLNILFTYIRRLAEVLKLILLKGKNDLVWIEYELLPFMPPFLEWLLKTRGIKYIVDYDDAIFHNYDQSPNLLIKFFLKNKIPFVIKYAYAVITGSPYLTEYSKLFNEKVIEIPTSINMDKYRNNSYIAKGDVFTIGWVGSKSTSENLFSIIPALKNLTQKYNLKVVLVGFDKNLQYYFDGINNVAFLDWDSESEICIIKTFHVGIMPLKYTLFNRGKCGFKLIQYMAAGIPTIATPLEANIKINRSAKNLFATTGEEWQSALQKIYENWSFYNETGNENIQIVTQFYCIQANYKTYISLFDEINSTS